MSLFLKIFLWFWGAMTILALALVVILSTTQEEMGMPSRGGSMLGALLRYSLNSVVAFESGGDAKLRNYLTTVSKQTGVKVYLFDPQGHARGLKSGERAPDDVHELAQRTLMAGQMKDDYSPQFELSAFRVTASQPVVSRNGIYIFAGSISRPLLAFRRIDTRTKVLGISFIFLSTGFFCYGLARYLAAPVGRIRRAAQRITVGDLSARVEPNHVPRGHDEIASLARDFDTMAERMQNLVTAQNRLLGDVSHELRSPLARLNLALELARRGDETKKMAALQRIERESARLDVLIGELLTLSRLENGLRPETLQNIVDLAVISREIAADADFEAQNAGRGVKVTFTGADKGIIVRGDPELLRRAIENMTRNALRHTDDDSTVALELLSEGNDIALTVADQGPGVPEEELTSIFRPFYRVEGARERSEGGSGTGLGLAIAQRAVAAHGGNIRASNRETGGLKVRLTLPKTRALPKNERVLSAVA